MQRIYYILIPFLVGTMVGALGGFLFATSPTESSPDPALSDPEQTKIETAILIGSQFNRKVDEIKARIAFDCAEFEERGHGDCDQEKLGEILDALDRTKVGNEETISWLGLPS